MAEPHVETDKEEVDKLRARVAALSGHVEPKVKQAAAQAKEYVAQAQDVIAERTEPVARWARNAPLTAVLIACGIGYLTGRIVR